MPVEKVDWVRGRDRNELVVVFGQRGADIIHNWSVVFGQIQAGLAR
jgi:hypothetical protein